MAQSVIQTETETDTETPQLSPNAAAVPECQVCQYGFWVQSDRQKQTQDRQKHLNSHLIQSPSLNAKLVLVDSDHTLVEQQVPRLWFNVAQVIGHVERCGHHGPNCHLHPLLVVAQAKVSHNDLCTPSQQFVYTMTMIYTP